MRGRTIASRARAPLPTLVAVDFTSVDDLFGVVDTLNGLNR
jgi:hypothetical protein